jgi:hypothetical protein
MICPQNLPACLTMIAEVVMLLHEELVVVAGCGLCDGTKAFGPLAVLLSPLVSLSRPPSPWSEGNPGRVTPVPSSSTPPTSTPLHYILTQSESQNLLFPTLSLSYSAHAKTRITHTASANSNYLFSVRKDQIWMYVSI